MSMCNNNNWIRYIRIHGGGVYHTHNACVRNIVFVFFFFLFGWTLEKVSRPQMTIYTTYGDACELQIKPASITDFTLDRSARTDDECRMCVDKLHYLFSLLFNWMCELFGRELRRCAAGLTGDRGENTKRPEFTLLVKSIYILLYI